MAIHTPAEPGPYGFRWGSLRVERITTDDRIGFVVRVESVLTGRGVNVRVSPKGRRVMVLETDTIAAD